MRGFVKTVRLVSLFALILCTLVWTAILVSGKTTADSYYVECGQTLEISRYIKAEIKNDSIESISLSSEKTQNGELRLFGIFPIKTVSISQTDRKCVVPGGIPFGIKMISNGVMVTAVSAINCDGKLTSPARDAGIKSGDVILSINGRSVKSNLEVVDAVNQANGKSIKVSLKQNGKTKEVTANPIFDKTDKSYKIGVWVRDSSAGIGTVTFYDPQSSLFGGLGHAVCDSDTGNALALLEGEIVGAEIDSVTKGQNGAPGQLCGHFSPYAKAGKILINDDTGVFGTMSNVKVINGSIPVALKQQIKTGKATILTTIDGSQPQEFEIEIERICYNNARKTKNMIVHVTDQRLLDKTGGIVQGMSGSPIIQNGKLVGAVSHVFINDSARGYAIFAENMLETAREAEQLKEAA